MVRERSLVAVLGIGLWTTSVVDVLCRNLSVMYDDSRPWTPPTFEPAVAYPGPFTRAAAVADGLSDAQLARWVEEARLRKLLTGVYLDATIRVDLRVRARAIALIAPPEAVVVDRTAAWLHGMDLLHRSAVHETPPVELYLAKETRVRRPGVDSGRRQLLRRDVDELHGVRVTTPLRTSLDLARSMWRYDALGALDRYVAAGLVTIEALLVELPRFRGWRGVRQARMLLPLVDPLAESMPESALRLHWHDAMLPWPHAQHWVYDGDFGLYRLDLADPKVRYSAEYDGEEFHSSDEAMVYDAERRRWCQEHHGWQFDVFTKASVYGLKPHPTDVLSAGWHRARELRRRT